VFLVSRVLASGTRIYVAAIALVLVFMRGTSTKSAVSDRGEEEESTAEDDKDHTISSSSEGESVAHWSPGLEVRERMSIDDDKEVVIADAKRSVSYYCTVGRLFIDGGEVLLAVKGSVNYN